MPRIDFAFGAPHRLQTACQVVHKHYLAGRRLLVYCSQETVLRDFDQLLWRFEPTAFVPHVAAADPLAPQTPVLLCQSEPHQWLDRQADGVSPWLLNLDMQCPPSFAQFTRILEVVSNHDDDKLAARERWRSYAAAGHTPNAYDLTARQR